MKIKYTSKLIYLIAFLICFEVNIFAADPLPTQPAAPAKPVQSTQTGNDATSNCEREDVVNNEGSAIAETQNSTQVNMGGETTGNGETNAGKAENVTDKVENKTTEEVTNETIITTPTPIEEVQNATNRKLGNIELHDYEKNDGAYDCNDLNKHGYLDARGVWVSTGDDTWDEETPGKCDEQLKTKIRDTLNDWGTEVSNAMVSYLDMEFYTNAPSGNKIYVNKGHDGDNVAIYTWNETTNNPIYYYYTITMKQMFFLDTVNSAYGFDPNYDTFNGYESNSRIYDFYVINVDNQNARYYKANNGKYFRLINGTLDGAVGPGYSNEITFYSDVDKDRGTNYVTRVRFQNDKWLRHFSGVSAWNCVWYGENGNMILNNSVKDSFHGKTNSTQAFHQEYYTMQELTTIRYTRKENKTERTLSLVPFNNAPFQVLVEPTSQLDYINNKAWEDVEELAVQNEQVEVYGGYKRGHIEINKETGIWTWKEHRQAEQLSQTYVLQPNISTSRYSNSYTVCMGQYHCDCEDINVLCSGEDEEAGLSPEIACPDGKDCSGPVADGYGGNPSNIFGESKRVYNTDGNLVPSGGPGGVTGKGSADYYEKYLTGSATLVE